jgi:DNA topoisomerase-1
MAVPPMFNEFWVATKESSKIQAIWLDSKGRKQYLYNDKFVNSQKDKKYIRMKHFVKKLPSFWRRVNQDIKSNSIDPKTRNIAHLFLIVRDTHIRVGNEKYYKENGSIGLTTLRNSHITFQNNPKRAKLCFKGKSHMEHELEITNPNAIRFLKHICKPLTKNQIVFSDIQPNDLNRYLQSVIGKPFTVKDFRTIAANSIFINQIRKQPTTNPKQAIREALKHTAKQLGHRTATSKKSYVSERLTERYLKNPILFNKKNLSTLLKLA